ncbi:MAG: prolyl oligopeptidase family serine peptidase, partial [Verrucomicrobiae bacterium]|nr:prolyl oligopeptidase family serine peptidase [Verrucomicrobiae bacterium]
WTTQTGLVVRGFISRIDDTVQPYGLVVPETYQAGSAHRHRLDIWLHGRNESITENAFLLQRRSQTGQYTPADTFVVHPYGRYSNAFKFAGETDVLESLAEVQRRYSIDEDRISMRGFSMGGAGCWQFAVHYPDWFFAANPGAGFSETRQFLESFQGQTLNPTWWEEKLWRLYDCDLYAANLFNTSVIAYSGEIDKQKQAADVMEEALQKLGMKLTHIIGPQTAHKIHPDSAVEIESRMAALAVNGRDTSPSRVLFTTYSLKYNTMKWVRIDGMKEHWEPARVDAEVIDGKSIIIKTENVSGLSLNMESGSAPFDLQKTVSIKIDGQAISGVQAETDRSFHASLYRESGKWKSGVQATKEGTFKKVHNLQGPVDDAFMERFIFVTPTRRSTNTHMQDWSTAELERAIEHWRRHFRGDAIVKKDTEITDDDIASANLVLWGDPTSNAFTKRIAGQLPIHWDAQSIQVGKQLYSSDDHGLILIYPNPLNPEHYVVLNSSFTFRDFAYLNNARQVPMLPDWAVVNLDTPSNSVWPGKVVEAGFFDESWQLKPAQ